MGIEEWKDEFENKRIFLIGNGPSLSETPLEKLDSEYTFAVNKISKIYDKTSWRPKFYYNPIGDWDTDDFRPYVKEHIELDIPCFFPEHATDRVNNINGVQYKNNIYYYNHNEVIFEIDSLELDEIRSMNVDRLEEYWSDDISERVCNCHSMYAMMQIAVYMGFDEIYLIGCDLGYDDSQPHMLFKSALDPVEYYIDRDRNKFDFLKDGLNSGTLLGSILNGVITKIAVSDHFYPIWRKLISLGYLEAPNNHFSSEYHNKLKISTLNYGINGNTQVIKSHVVANRIQSVKDFNIYNATLGGNLEVYPRVDFESVLKE